MVAEAHPSSLKVVLLGEGACLLAAPPLQCRGINPAHSPRHMRAGRVGKTSLVSKYCQGSFKETQRATEQAAFNKKRVLVGDRQVVCWLPCPSTSAMKLCCSASAGKRKGACVRDADNGTVLRRRSFCPANIPGWCRSSSEYGTPLAKSAFTPYSRSTTATPTLCGPALAVLASTQPPCRARAPTGQRLVPQALLVFDLTDSDSLERVRAWVTELQTLVGPSAPPLHCTAQGLLASSRLALHGTRLLASALHCTAQGCLPA